LTDKLSPEQRSVNMRAIKSKDTKPELAVRRLAHSMGYRYRLHRKDLPGKPDLVFPGRKKVIFVHGCFWHQHELEQCLDGRRPKSNTVYWDTKLQRNVERDIRNQEKLREAGWRSLVVWECEIRDVDRIRSCIGSFLDRTD
jgi:DNA mismatch endonuclease, patch repair protein